MKTWSALQLAHVHSTTQAIFSHVDGAEAHGYVHSPPVKETVAAHLCPAAAKTLGSDISLPSKPYRTTAHLANKAYASDGEAASALHAPTQVIAAHIAAHPTTKPLKPLCQFKSAWKVITGISRWQLSVKERRYTLQFRHRPPRFNGVVQSLTLPRNAQALRQEIGCLLEKGAVERVPPSELESVFYSRYFVVPKRDGGLRPILDLRSINRALCKRPYRTITLKQILAQIRPGDWFASVDLKDAHFHIQIAPHDRHHFFKVHGCSTFPPQSERDTHPQLSG